MNSSQRYLLIIFAFFTFGCEKRVNMETEKVHLQKRFASPNDTTLVTIWDYKGLPFTGVLYEEYPNKKIKKEVPIKDGLIDGELSVFDQNGNKSVKIFFSNGITNETELYFENGKLAAKGKSKVDKNLQFQQIGWWIMNNEKGDTTVQVFYNNGNLVSDKSKLISPK